MLDFNSLTNKQGLIVWGGVDSTSYGIVVEECPAFDKPTKSTEVFNVPGRNGAIIRQDGSFDDVPKNYKVWIDENIQYDSGGNVISGTLAERINNFTAALLSKNGWQKLEDNFEPDVFRLAYYSGGNEFSDELMMYGKATLKFTARAERFFKSGELPIAFAGGTTTFNNPTLFTSKPLWTVTGTGSVTLTSGGKTMAITLGTNESIQIDAERMNAYYGSTNKNNQISGEFPVLAPGSNTISTTGTVSLAQFLPRYFTI